MSKEDEDELLNQTTSSPYEEAMSALSSLITTRTRAEKSNTGDRFDLLYDYVKILELEELISKLKVIHVAGTKGKGSTCVFAESILRNCGFSTGLFTSPHLIDVRERFRLNGTEICRDKFLAYFWWCYDMLKENATDNIPMPTYFRFLSLLAFKIFSAEQVDVAIMEVGLGGRYDATNVVEAPVVCGISALGYDHMEILGNTLGQIAGEKAGIFKEGIPAFTVAQTEEAMSVLKQNGSELNVNLQVASPLDPNLLNGLQLGLGGDHQLVNAGLAVSLCSTWLQRMGNLDVPYDICTNSLPEQFIKGLVTASFQGRAQIFADEYVGREGSEDLVFYLDGAHSPESMEVCAKWFFHAIKKDAQLGESIEHQASDKSSLSQKLACGFPHSTIRKSSAQILLFNCMSVRDPQLLLPPLMKTCERYGVHFQQALFVPNVSVYNKDISTVPQPDKQVDVSWQLTLQRVWESLIKGGHAKGAETSYVETRNEMEKGIINGTNSKVFPTLPLAIKWLRDNARQTQSVRLQVLVTGSLHLIGDVLRLIRK